MPTPCWYGPSASSNAPLTSLSTVDAVNLYHRGCSTIGRTPPLAFATGTIRPAAKKGYMPLGAAPVASKWAIVCIAL